MMEKTAFLDLIEHVTNGTATDEQLKLYSQYMNAMKGDGKWDREKMGDEAETKLRLLGLINEETDLSTKNKSYKLWYKVAAAVLLVTSVGLYLFLNERKTNVIPQEITAANDIAPGGNRAVLTLGNGDEIDLATADVGELISKGGMRISKIASGVLEYKVVGPVTGNLNEIHKLSTPIGGVYQLILPDGSKVRLNALSSLKYPSSFAVNRKRNVELTGEGYFEVTKSSADRSMTFTVTTDKQEVEVLGTRFNVNSYENEPSTRTTLIEGVVRVSRQQKIGPIQSLILKPGQESVLTDRTFEVVEGNVSVIEAWQRGKFLFDDEHITSIMRKIARWYDVETIYPVAMPRDLNFSGSISKNKNLSQILRIMELTGAIHFKISGRTLYVMSEK